VVVRSTETPPETSSIVGGVEHRPARPGRARSSATVARRTTSAPAHRQRRQGDAAGVVDLARREGRGLDQLVACGSTATRGRRAHGTSARPAETATPSSAGPSVVPAASTVARVHVLAGRAQVLAGATAARTSTWPSDSAASSTRTTASAPAGTTAPVEMRSPAVAQRAIGRLARARLAHDRERAPGRAGHQREAVHGRVGERRHVASGGDVARQYGPERGGDRNGFGLSGRTA
jgi:hypothetical protein